MYFFYLDFLSVKLFVVLWPAPATQSIFIISVFVPRTTIKTIHLSTIVAFHISVVETVVARFIPLLHTPITEFIALHMLLTAIVFTIQAYCRRNTTAFFSLALRQRRRVWNNLLEDIVREEEGHRCCSVVWLLPRYSLSLGVNLFQFFKDCIFVCLCLDLYGVVVPLFGCCRDVLYFFNKIHFNFLRIVFHYTF